MTVHALTLPSFQPSVFESSAALPPAGAGVAILDSEQLLKGHREILIRHGDRVYHLRHTRNDKLILTK
ncbi:MAG: hemin uptake protein HemP [Xanthomonadaceae bacterium]|nr:hemin uptake protein HemP [Xanthomonadaceae bacterium]